MQAGVVDIDGVLQPAAEAKVSVFDRGFLYGDSVFEVMRTYGKRPFRARQHLERLQRSCERIRMQLPLDIPAIEARILAAVAASGQPECWVRVVATRGSGPVGLELEVAERPSLLVYALPLKSPPAELYERGISVGLSQTQRALDGTAAAGAKVSNYLASMLALDEVRKRGAREAIILGPGGEVVEGATSNVFVVKNGELLTPPISTGLLEGITRRAVFELARDLALPARERELRPDDLLSADELFITSSIREILPVVAVDERTVAGGAPGPITKRLLDAYRALATRES